MSRFDVFENGFRVVFRYVLRVLVGLVDFRLLKLKLGGSLLLLLLLLAATLNLLGSWLVSVIELAIVRAGGQRRRCFGKKRNYESANFSKPTTTPHRM